MAIFSDEQPLGLHLQLEPLNGLDHSLRCEQMTGRTTEAVQLPSSCVGAERHLLFGGSFGHIEVVNGAHGEGHSIHYTKQTWRAKSLQFNRS